MIPDFPDFVHLELCYVPEMRRLTSGLPEYSDYNPVSMLAWDIDGSTLISKLQDNLVVVFRDYLNGSRFISIHGKHCNQSSILEVIAYAEKHGLNPTLRLVPEEVIKKLRPHNSLTIYPDRNNYDYIVTLNDVITLAGKKHRRFRQQLNTFKSRFESTASIVTLDLNNPLHVSEIYKVFHTRESKKIFNDDHTELIALSRCIALSGSFNIVAKGVRIAESLEGFVIYESSDQQLVEHFKKANTAYPGVYQYLLNSYYHHLSAEWFRTINIEQDFGFEGLRKSKEKLQSSYRKKYVIARSAPLRSAQVSGLQQLSLQLTHLQSP